MSYSIFFSWQSDTPSNVGRNMIERALSLAIKNISLDLTVEEAVREGLAIDRDTKGVAGSPPIVDTIFNKIDASRIFVADVSFVGKRPNEEMIPNPNVLIEYGWALKSLGHSRIITVMNTAYGDPSTDQLPFDMRHLRHPLKYHCPEDATEEDRKQLAKQFQSAIKGIIESTEFKASLPKQPELPLFPEKPSLNGPSRFRATGQPLGICDVHSPGTKPHDIQLRDGPSTWFRLMPQFGSGRIFKLYDLRNARQSSLQTIMPLYFKGEDLGHVRGEDGIGFYVQIPAQPHETWSTSFAFTTGEVWAVDAFPFKESSAFFLDEHAFETALGTYAVFLEHLGLKPPYKWIAGIDGIQGKALEVPTQPDGMSVPRVRGYCVADYICESGTYTPGDATKESLRPFFEAVYDKCGLKRHA